MFQLFQGSFLPPISCPLCFSIFFCSDGGVRQSFFGFFGFLGCFFFFDISPIFPISLHRDFPNCHWTVSRSETSPLWLVPCSVPHSFVQSNVQGDGLSLLCNIYPGVVFFSPNRYVCFKTWVFHWTSGSWVIFKAPLCGWRLCHERLGLRFWIGDTPRLLCPGDIGSSVQHTAKQALVSSSWPCFLREGAVGFRLLGRWLFSRHRRVECHSSAKQQLFLTPLCKDN